MKHIVNSIHNNVYSVEASCDSVKVTLIKRTAVYANLDGIVIDEVNHLSKDALKRTADRFAELALCGWYDSQLQPAHSINEEDFLDWED